MANLWRLGAVAGLGALLLSGCGTEPVALSHHPVPASLRTRAPEVTDQTARVSLLPGTSLGLDACRLCQHHRRVGGRKRCDYGHERFRGVGHGVFGSPCH